MDKRPDIKTIRCLDERPEPPSGMTYEFKPAISLDSARGVVLRQKKAQGWFLRNRVYFLVPEPQV